MAQAPGDRPKSSTDTYAKIKYDRQIAAIAKVEGATAIYSDDDNVRSYAQRLGIRAIALADLPLPLPTTPDLFAQVQDAVTQSRQPPQNQRRRSTPQRHPKLPPQFLEVARELECPEDKEAFDRALRQIASAGPVPKHQPKKREPKG